MRRAYYSTLALAASIVLPAIASAQGGAAMAGMGAMSNEDRLVAGGGITAKGWLGKADGAGKVSDAKLTMTGNVLNVTTGPAITYWNPANVASGNYTVKATFFEPKFQNLNDHPHPYGIVIGGNNLGEASQSLLYCAAYGDGTFIVRGFAPDAPKGVFQMGGRNPTPDAAVHKAEAVGKPVTQEIAIKVSADKVECIINGKSVASYPKTDVVGAGKLKSTDGMFGIRFAHNTEATVTGLTMTKQ